MKTNKKHPLISRLSLAALALPGLMQDASAGRVEETYNGDFQYGHYAEGHQRMEVDIFEAALSAPIGKSITASVNVVRDVISGASPIYNKPNAKGDVKQTLSGASITDQRDAISSSLTYFFDKASLGLAGGFSKENDYTSRYVSTNASIDLNNKLTTLNFGASVAFDEVQPTAYSSGSLRNTDCGAICSKTSQQYLLGVSQVIDKDSIIQSNITFGYHNGYLADPYKKVYFTGDGDLAGQNYDVRPREKFQWAWLTQYVHHFQALNSAALHTDYRFYTDDWGINSHTVDLSWNQPIADGWQVIPRFRYYSQDRADFYQPVFDSAQAPDIYSSDYRLASFGSLSGGIKLSKEFTQIKSLSQLKFQTGIEYYDHKSSYQLGGNGSGSFDDFSYYLLTASVNAKF
ncbi:MAG: DUF3570 domain-containing protein [Methylococcales bacterium]|nr:DUF3570 domain-containing protein [Methylococcales bacterium]